MFKREDISTEMRNDRPLRSWFQLGVGVAISVVCLIFMLQKIDLDEVGRSLLNFDARYLAIGLISLAFGYAMRILRWAILLQAAGARITPLRCAAPFLGSVALNNVLPFRAGDIIRALVFPNALGIKRTTATASLLLERLIDLLSLLICLGVGLVFSPGLSLPQWLHDAAISLAIFGGGIIASVVILNRTIILAIGKLIKIMRRYNWQKMALILLVISELVEGLSAMCRPHILVILFLVSFFVWAGEAGLYFALLKGVRLNVGPNAALMVMAMSTLATLVPSSPGYIGSFHLAAFTAISMFGATSAAAGSFAILTHLSLWLPTTLVGITAILIHPALFRGKMHIAST